MNVNSELQKEIEQVFAEAELLYSADEVDAAINKMAREISQALKDKNPVVLCLMIGAVIPVGKLLPKLQFPLQLEYVHASRYRGETSGGDIDWIKRPALDLQGRVVLIIDDILDEGITLAAIIDAKSARAQASRSRGPARTTKATTSRLSKRARRRAPI